MVSRRFCWRACVLALSITNAPFSISHASGMICKNVANQVSKEMGIPHDVLMAITLTETGRSKNGRIEPWPWTVNMEGKGLWFESLDRALSYAYQHFEDGARSFDVGCFQLNYRWHGENFTSIDQMFDPLENARYAAEFLVALYAEFGDWSVAAGAYHSRTKKYATKYREKFDELRTQFASLEPNVPPALAIDRGTIRTSLNRYPLLRSGDLVSPGSLVPLSGEARPLFDRRSR